jgi:hypothetical protein
MSKSYCESLSILLALRSFCASQRSFYRLPGELALSGSASRSPSSFFGLPVAVQRAMREAEHGWQRAKEIIAQHAGLTKNSDGSWSRPADVKNAAA